MSAKPKKEVPSEEILAVVEAVLFSSGEPVRPAEIAEAIGGFDEDQVLTAIEELTTRYEERRGGLRVEMVAGGVQFATRTEVGAWVRRFFRNRNRTRISAAALETLAIVAYRQPVTAPEVQSIRGKDPVASLKTLLEKKLIRMMGKKKVIGRPILYGTTKQFLMHFGLNSLEDLPAFEEFEQLVGSLIETTAAEEQENEGEPETRLAAEDRTVSSGAAAEAGPASTDESRP